MKYRDLEEQAIKEMDQVLRHDSIQALKEKRAELLEAEKVVRRLKFEYNELLERDIE